MNLPTCRSCSIARLTVCLVLAGGIAFPSSLLSSLKAHPLEEQGTGTATPVAASETPTPAGEIVSPTPPQSPEDTPPPVTTPPGQDSGPDPVETPAAPQDITLLPTDATPTQESPTLPSPEIPPTPSSDTPVVTQTPVIYETPAADTTDAAPLVEDGTPFPEDAPPTQENLSTITPEVSATPEGDLPPSISDTLTTTLTITTYLDLPLVVQSAPGAVIINEIAWAGTVADATAQWIELYNTTSQPILLNGWQLITVDGHPVIDLVGVIAAQGYFLLECNDDLTIRDVPADNIYIGTLSLDGEVLRLLDADGAVIDTANADGGPWPAGERATRRSMERIAPQAPDSDSNWITNNSLVRNGEDVSGNPINGTPRQPNSTLYPAAPGEVVINEVAWSGTQADAHAEWIELINTTEHPINVTGWRLAASDGQPDVVLQGTIAAHGFFLLETKEQAVANITADQVASFGDGLDDGGETLQLLLGNLVIDTANADGGPWPSGEGSPTMRSMERISPHMPDTDSAWTSHDGFHHIAYDAEGNPINGTPRAANSTLLPPLVLISEFLYAGNAPVTQGDEFVELCNAQPSTVTLRDLKIGDAARGGRDESMFRLPSGITLAPDDCLVIAKNAAYFAARFGFSPDFEMVTRGTLYTDTATVPDLIPYAGWAGSAWALDDSGDEIVLLGPSDQIVDSVAYLNGDYASVGLSPDPTRAPSPNSLQRLWPLDSNVMPADFVRTAPSPGRVTRLPQPPPAPPPAARLSGGMRAYWGVLNFPSSYSKGNAPPALAFAAARAAGIHFLAVTDDATKLNPRLWSDCQQRSSTMSAEGQFIALCGFQYFALPHSFATVWNTFDYITPSGTSADALAGLHAWLAARPGALASLHRTSPTSPWRELPYQPASAPLFHLWQVYSQTHPPGVPDPLETAWMQMLAAGWQLAPLPDPASTNHEDMGFGAQRVGVIAPQLTSDELSAALRARRVFVTQDEHLALALHSGDHWMGSTLATPHTLTLEIDVVDVGTIIQPITVTLFDRALPLAVHEFHSSNTSWSLSVTPQPGHYYWVRAVQADGDLASSAPIWVAGTAPTEAVAINEVLPAPHRIDWNGDGTPDRRDEWIELYNPAEAPIGLGGWQLSDASGKSYVLPLLTTIPAHSFVVLHAAQTNLVLNNPFDMITLQRADGTLVERYTYEQGPGYDLSLCRLPDGIGSWQRRCQPTPGQANQALPSLEPVTTDIRGARHLPLGSWVKVRGHITVPPSIFSPRVAYLQDDHSGIRLYLPKDHRLWCTPGDRVEVVAHTSNYYGELQLRVYERNDVHRIREGTPPSPLPVMSGQMVEPYEGMLIQLSGRVTELEGKRAFWLDDGTGPARVYLDPDANIQISGLSLGQMVHVVGVVSQYRSAAGVHNEGYRLLPRFTSDLQYTMAQQDEMFLVPIRLPETGAR